MTYNVVEQALIQLLQLFQRCHLRFGNRVADNPYGVAEAAQAWLPDGRLFYDRLDWDEENQTGKHSLWTITYVNNVAGAPQPAVAIPLAYDQTTLLERLPPEFQNAGSFSWSPDNQWVTFHAGDWPDIAVCLWHWENSAAPYRLLQGTSPQWQSAPPPTP